MIAVRYNSVVLIVICPLSHSTTETFQACFTAVCHAWVSSARVRGFSLVTQPMSRGSCTPRCGGLALCHLCTPVLPLPDFIQCVTRFWLSHESLACFFHHPVVFPSMNIRQRICFSLVDADSGCAVWSLRESSRHVLLLRARMCFRRAHHGRAAGLWTVCVPSSSSRAERRWLFTPGHWWRASGYPTSMLSRGIAKCVCARVCVYMQNTYVCIIYNV